jgi:transglutaminase/protease-like cytokinesis protein 3
MIQVVKKILPFLFLLAGTQAIAQSHAAHYREIDDYVKSLGALDTLNMGTISYILTKKFPDSRDKSRAIYDWIAYNINFDVKAARTNGNEVTPSDVILKSRKATSSGYAALFQDMCSVAKIRCLTVDGYLKNNVEQFTEKPDEFNHTWNVVQLGQSTESWFYVDVALGAGYTDDRMTTFTKAYDDAYFFADKTIFNLQHYPDNKAWLLGQATKNSKSFFSMPLVKNAAYEFGVNKFSPDDGFIKTSTSAGVQFSFTANTGSAIDIVALAIGEDKKKKVKTVDYTFSKGVVKFSYKFDVENSYPVTILVNNKPVLTYLVEATE